MISLGRRDAVEELGLGLGFGGGGRREMEDTELEEGEACSDHHSNDNYYNSDNRADDGSVDPDIALSYIDEKLQDVLGHFQKDFEGGEVSAENLGAKFGGYGSFLPMYQRSPVWSQSHSRSPPKNQKHNAPARSPNNTTVEGSRSGSISLSTAPQSVELEPASTAVMSRTVLKASSSPTVVKQEAGIPSSDLPKGHALRYKSMNRKNSKFPDQKLLKVRIKVGSDNFSTQKNAAIYSGLGLDASPSSSLGDSPFGSEEISHRPQDSPFESPARILQIMTSFPLLGGILMSPLPDDLIDLTEKIKFQKGSLPFSVLTIDPESSGIVLNGSAEGDMEILGEKKLKSVERNGISAEPKSENKRDSWDGVDVLSKEQVDIDNLACEDLVSNTLKLPLLSDSYSGPDTVKGMVRSSNILREAANGVASDKDCSDLIKEELSGSISTHGEYLIEKQKATSVGKKNREGKKAASLGSITVHPQTDGHVKGEKPNGSVRSDSTVSKGMNTASYELTDTLKQKVDRKVASSEKEGAKFAPAKERSYSDSRKKVKGSQHQSNVVAELPNDDLANGFPSVAKSKKCTSFNEYLARGELENLKSQKNVGEAGDRYKDFFGDFEIDQVENQMTPPEMSNENRQKNSYMGEKRALFSNTTSKERPSGMKSDKLPKVEAHLEIAPSSIPPTGNGPITDVAHVGAAPAAIQDSWVCCDQCQKWRLLPLGKNPDDLPEKWVCSMLYWLPGMNRCSSSQEETTNAAMALNQVPSLASRNNLQTNAPISGATVVADQLDHNHQYFGLHAIPSGGKKKTSKDGTTQSSNSMKRTIHASVTNGNSNEESQPMVSEPDFLKVSKTSDSVLDKHIYRQKEEHKVLDNYSDGGDPRQSKMKGKSVPDEDMPRFSKKIKAEGLPEDLVSDHVNIEKVGVSSTDGFPAMSSGKNLAESSGHTSSKDQASARNSKDKVSVALDDVSTGIGNQEDKEVAKKRKVRGGYDTQVDSGSISIKGHDLQDGRTLAKEEFNDSEYMKKKKARASKSDGKESSASKGSDRTDRNGSHRMNQEPGKRWSLDGLDSLKRDSGALHLSGAATSSSSKASSSRRNKTNFQETRGSPVDSVSSSPLRHSKQGNVTSGRRSFTEKDDSSDAGGLAQGGWRRCSDVEDGGSDLSAAAKKGKSLEVAYHGSHESLVFDLHEKYLNCASHGNAKRQLVASSNIENHLLANGNPDLSAQDNLNSNKTASLDLSYSDDRHHESLYPVNVSHARKSGKGCSSRSKEKNRISNSELDNSKNKVSHLINEHAPFEVKPTNGKSKNEENSGLRYDESDTKYAARKDSVVPQLGESSKKEGRSKIQVHSGVAGKEQSVCNHDATSISKQGMLPDSEAVPGREKSPLMPPSGGMQHETVAHCPQPDSASYRKTGAKISVSDAFNNDNPSKTVKQSKKVDYPNGPHQNCARDPLPNGCRAKDLDASSPVKRDSSSQAATNALKEAKNLKHLADRVKNSGSNVEGTRLYFEAALNFLHAASLLETSSSENAKSGEMIHSMQVYSSTAKLCEFCAREFEKSKDMAAAALAYKCMEVAFMRVIYSSHNSANKDRHELQMAPQIVPPGESPSSSASDVDNLNHPVTTDKGTLVKNVSSPQVTGSHIIAAQNRPNFVRLLKFVEEVHFAMEASRKSRIALAAANASLGESQCMEGMSSIKTALDFGFQDVEGLLRLVRLAIKAIGR